MFVFLFLPFPFFDFIFKALEALYSTTDGPGWVDKENWVCVNSCD